MFVFGLPIYTSKGPSYNNNMETIANVGDYYYSKEDFDETRLGILCFGSNIYYIAVHETARGTRRDRRVVEIRVDSLIVQSTCAYTYVFF